MQLAIIGMETQSDYPADTYIPKPVWQIRQVVEFS